jgi:hypothetical protein
VIYLWQQIVVAMNGHSVICGCAAYSAAPTVVEINWSVLEHLFWGISMQLLKRLTALLAIGVVVGCTTLTSQQKTQYDLMQKDGVLIQEKTPSTGAWFGLLPGGGSFYGRQPAVGVLDLLLWPLSVLWDPVVGYETSKKVNYDLTVGSLQREKEKALSELENQKDLKNIDDVTYVARKREIEQKYNYPGAL